MEPSRIRGDGKRLPRFLNITAIWWQMDASIWRDTSALCARAQAWTTVFHREVFETFDEHGWLAQRWKDGDSEPGEAKRMSMSLALRRCSRNLARTFGNGNRKSIKLEQYSRQNFVATILKDVWWKLLHFQVYFEIQRAKLKFNKKRQIFYARYLKQYLTILFVYHGLCTHTHTHTYTHIHACKRVRLTSTAFQQLCNSNATLESEIFNLKFLQEIKFPPNDNVRTWKNVRGHAAKYVKRFAC